MRLFSLLCLALLLALGGQYIMTSAPAFAPYVLRDGLLLGLLAALLFAANAQLLPRNRHPVDVRSLNSLPAILTITGTVCIVVGGLITMMGPSQPLWRAGGLALLMLGFALFVIGGFVAAMKGSVERPTHRWQHDAQGNLIRIPLAEAADTTSPGHNDQPSLWLVLPMLLALVLLGAVLRGWAVETLPAECVGDECVRLLRLFDDAGTFFNRVNNLTDLIAFGLAQWLGPGVFSLRCASLLVGVATLPLLFIFATQVASRSAALLITLLLVFSAWHIAASASADLVIEMALYVTLAGLGMVRAYRFGASWLALVALLIGFGGPLIAFAPLRGPLGLWLLTAFLIGVFGGQRNFFVNALCALLFMLNAFLGSQSAGTPLLSFSTWEALTSDFVDLILTPLLGGLPDGSMGPLLTPLTGALILLGLGVLLRNLRTAASLLILSGLLVLGYGVVQTDPELVAPSSLLLALLPLLFLLAALALDQLLSVFQRAWAGVLQPSRVLAAATTLLLVVAVPGALTGIRTLGTVRASVEQSYAAAMSRLLIDTIQADPSVTVFVPPALLADATARMMAGDALNSPQVRPLSTVDDAIFVADAVDPLAGGDLAFFLPFVEQEALALLTQIVPGGTLEMHVDESTGQPLFTDYRVAWEQVRNGLGLQGVYFAGDGFGLAENAILTEATGDLAFFWGTRPPVEPPFSVQWQGSLLVAQDGNYGFSVLVDPAAKVSFALDNVVLLDTDAGHVENQRPLARGAYRVDINYHSGPTTAGDLVVRWQRPGNPPEPIPATLLRHPSLPDVGLVATYFGSAFREGPSLTVRKEMLVGTPPDLPRPFSVRWQGKLAASRAGEYLLAGLADGQSRVVIDGQPVFENDATVQAGNVGGEADDVGYAEGLIYLEQGWHDLLVEYAPLANQPQPRLQLFWQPPGGRSSTLPSLYLAPVQEAVTMVHLPLPIAPDLTRPDLATGNFALTVAPGYRNPQRVIPPTNLPPFSPGFLWQNEGGCGTNDAQLNQPHGVAMDPATGQVYVADSANRRIVVYALDGTLAEVVRSELFQEPFDVVVRTGGGGSEVLVLDAVAGQIFRLDAGGAVTPLPLDTSFYRPRGLAVDAVTGTIFVADTGGGRVVALAAEGQFLDSYGGAETLFGKGQPVDVVVANGRVWAVTAEDGRLWRLDSSVGENGSVIAVARSNTFDGPHFGALLDGSFFLTDPARRTILYAASSGQPMRHFGFDDYFVVPVGVDTAVVDGRLYMAVVDVALCAVSLWGVDDAG